MKEPTELVPFLQDVDVAFKEGADVTAEIFPGWEKHLYAHIESEVTGITHHTLTLASLRHAYALTHLRAGNTLDGACQSAMHFDGSPKLVATTVVALTTAKSYFIPDARHWRHSALIRGYAGQVGMAFLTECLHALAREEANTPERRERRRDSEFIYSEYVGSDGIGDETFLSDLTEPVDQIASVSLPPATIMLLVRGLGDLATDEQLGAAVTALVRYGLVRAFTKAEMTEVISLVAKIESSNA